MLYDVVIKGQSSKKHNKQSSKQQGMSKTAIMVRTAYSLLSSSCML
jgi:hypothetical protein